jgi:hypothetical protein
MRTMLIAHIPNSEATVKIFKENPKMVSEGIEAMLKKLNAQAAYFGEDEGERTAYVIVDIPSAEMIPVFMEPFFINLGAKVEIKPVMDIEDVKKGLSRVSF